MKVIIRKDLLLVAVDKAGEVRSGIAHSLKTSGDDVTVAAAAATQQLDEVQTVQLHLERGLPRRNEPRLCRVAGCGDEAHLGHLGSEVGRRSPACVQFFSVPSCPFKRRTLKQQEQAQL